MAEFTRRRKTHICEFERPGDFAWYTLDGRGECTGHPVSAGERPTHLWYIDVDRGLRRIAIAPHVAEGGRTWEWDGDLDNPKLAPAPDRAGGGRGAPTPRAAR